MSSKLSIKFNKWTEQDLCSPQSKQTYKKNHCGEGKKSTAGTDRRITCVQSLMQEKQRKSSCPITILGFLGSAATSVVIQGEGEEGRQYFNSVATLRLAPKTLNGLCFLLSFPVRSTDSWTRLIFGCWRHAAFTEHHIQSRISNPEGKTARKGGFLRNLEHTQMQKGRQHCGCHSDDLLIVGCGSRGFCCVFSLS